jgi:glucokinase
VAGIDEGRVRLRSERRYASGEFPSLAAIGEQFLAETGERCDLGSFAVAGPVLGDRSKATNLPWAIDAAELAKRFGMRRARLLNDLESVAWGVAALQERDFAVLQPGAQEGRGNACVVAAGTGLGEAGLYWDGSRHRAFATEGGHADFAPTDEREFALSLHLKRRFGRVSWERVVSGMGIASLYLFLVEWHGASHAPDVGAALQQGGDLAAAVSTAAAAGSNPLCVEAMDLFALLYGREAGNAALKHMALGGVYLGGGIAPKNLDLLRRGGFLRGFLDKGRMRTLMERMPVKVILSERAPLLGAARYVSSDRTEVRPG